MGRGLSDHHVAMCKVKLVGSWVKRKDVVVVGDKPLDLDEMLQLWVAIAI